MIIWSLEWMAGIYGRMLELENIWRGILVNYHFLINHSAQIMALALFLLVLLLFKLVDTIRVQQKQSYSEMLEQQLQIDHVQYRLSRLSRVCQENRDKQRFISNQLSRVDDSIFELEERIVAMQEALEHHQLLEIKAAEKIEEEG